MRTCGFSLYRRDRIGRKGGGVVICQKCSQFQWATVKWWKECLWNLMISIHLSNNPHSGVLEEAPLPATLKTPEENTRTCTRENSPTVKEGGKAT